MSKRQNPLCTLEELKQVDFLVRKIQFKNRATSAIIFAFEETAYAYINHCMHMNSPLDCQQDTVFDKTGKHLRCSMHGLMFDPKTGECESPVCFWQPLQALHIENIDGMLYFTEEHLTLI